MNQLQPHKMVGRARDRRIKSEMPNLFPTRSSGSGSSSSSRNGRSNYWATVLNVEETSLPKDGRDGLPSKTFVCKTCAAQFNQRSHLIAHTRTVHAKLKPFKCDECLLRFKKKSDRESHNSAVHLKRRPHICKICKHAFAKASNLTRHVKQVHPSVTSNSTTPQQPRGIRKVRNFCSWISLNQSTVQLTSTENLVQTHI